MPDPCTFTLPDGSTCQAGDHDGVHRHHTHHNGGELDLETLLAAVDGIARHVPYAVGDEISHCATCEDTLTGGHARPSAHTAWCTAGSSARS